MSVNRGVLRKGKIVKYVQCVVIDTDCIHCHVLIVISSTVKIHHTLQFDYLCVFSVIRFNFMIVFVYFSSHPVQL